jgi:hypothetical protein
VHLAHWPDATATASGSMRGVALQALSATVELGFRAGDQPGPSPAFGATPALVLEPVLTLARGLGVGHVFDRTRGRRAPASLRAGGSALRDDRDFVRHPRGDRLRVPRRAGHGRPGRTRLSRTRLRTSARSMGGAAAGPCGARLVRGLRLDGPYRRSLWGAACPRTTRGRHRSEVAATGPALAARLLGSSAPRHPRDRRRRRPARRSLGARRATTGARRPLPR